MPFIKVSPGFELDEVGDVKLYRRVGDKLIGVLNGIPSVVFAQPDIQLSTDSRNEFVIAQFKAVTKGYWDGEPGILVFKGVILKSRIRKLCRVINSCIM